MRVHNGFHSNVVKIVNQKRSYHGLYLNFKLNNKKIVIYHRKLICRKTVFVKAFLSFGMRRQQNMNCECINGFYQRNSLNTKFIIGLGKNDVIWFQIPSEQQLDAQIVCC